MSQDRERRRPLQWLHGIAVLATGDGSLPLMACASRSELRPVGGVQPVGSSATRRTSTDRGALQLIVNDDHGMAPSVTIVNRTDAPLRLLAVRPTPVATDYGVYDLDALLSGGPYLVEPGNPLVIRIVDIGRDVGEAFRCGRAVSGAVLVNEL